MWQSLRARPGKYARYGRHSNYIFIMVSAVSWAVWGKKKKKTTESCSTFMHVFRRAAIFLLLCHVACWHCAATCKTFLMSLITVLLLLDIETALRFSVALFKVFISLALLVIFFLFSHKLFSILRVLMFLKKFF